MVHGRRFIVKCEKCGDIVEQQDCQEFHGQMICEDCYIDALSPAKACDPWAVYSAKSFSKESGNGTNITETQLKILQILKETGGAEPKIISERLQISPSDLEREVATLRHMEKLRAELRQGKKIICLW
jgi:hypothetical protein